MILFVVPTAQIRRDLERVFPDKRSYKVVTPGVCLAGFRFKAIVVTDRACRERHRFDEWMEDVCRRLVEPATHVVWL